MLEISSNGQKRILTCVNLVLTVVQKQQTTYNQQYMITTPVLPLPMFSDRVVLFGQKITTFVLSNDCGVTDQIRSIKATDWIYLAFCFSLYPPDNIHIFCSLGIMNYDSRVWSHHIYKQGPVYPYPLEPSWCETGQQVSSLEASF